MSDEVPMYDVAFVGVGPGDERLLTVRAVELLTSATTVVCEPGPLAELAGRVCPDSTPVIEPGPPLVDLVSQGRRGLVRLVPGQGIGPDVLREVAALRRAGAHVEVVPGVAPGPAVAAYSGVPVGPNASLNGQAPAGAVHVLDLASAADLTHVPEDGSLVVTCPARALSAVLAGLLAGGRAEGDDVLIVRHGTTPQQTSTTTTLGAAAQDAPVAEADEDVVLVVGPVVRDRGDGAWFESRPLFGWHVLVPTTRASDTEEMLARIAALGGTSEVVPTVTVAPPRTPQQMDRAIHRMVSGSHAWIAFTAEGAVRAVRDKLTELGLDVRALAGIRIAAVAGETADAVREWGLEPDLVPQAPGVRGLLEEWPPHDSDLDPISGVLLPRAQIATETLSAGLTELGWTVDEVTAFRTLRASPPAPAIRAGIKKGAYSAVLFGSAAGLRNFVGIAGKPHASTVVACIGPATVRAAEEHGVRVDVVAHEPTGVALVDALARYATTERPAATARRSAR